MESKQGSRLTGCPSETKQAWLGSKKVEDGNKISKFLIMGGDKPGCSDVILNRLVCTWKKVAQAGVGLESRAEGGRSGRDQGRKRVRRADVDVPGQMNHNLLHYSDVYRLSFWRGSPPTPLTPQ